MQKQTPLMLTLFLIMSSAVPFHVSRADTNPKMNDITQALQAEYQTQLKKARPRTKRRSNANRDILAAYNQYINKSSPRNNPRSNPRNNNASIRKVQARPAPRQNVPVRVVSAPIPDAEDLFNAASIGDVNTIARLLREGININEGNAQKETALHMAAARGHYSTVIFLINNHANPFARTVKQWLALHHATRFRHANIANYLMKKGLSPHFRTSDGYSSIDMASTNNDRPLLNVFGAR